MRGNKIAAVIGRALPRKQVVALALMLAAGISAPALARADADGATVYKRCAACHLPTRAGVPGAFPPLRGDISAFAETAEGRRYLVLVLTRGLSGPIKAEGKVYSGVMPAQSMLSDGEVAAVLNFLAQSKVEFTAEEVSQLRASGAGLSPAQVAELNTRLTSQ
jgi:mono/diheme cytochrome c family protein